MFDMSWYSQAACRGADVELFFAEDRAAASQAISICNQCPVRQPCLETAMVEREAYGVWGGTDQSYRQRVFRREDRARRRDSRAA